jgi:hypothetical protein
VFCALLLSWPGRAATRVGCGLIRAGRGFTSPVRHLLTRTARRGDTQRVALVRDALRLLGVLVTYPVSRRPVRPLPDEGTRSLPGGDLAADARIRWNHAITIRAHPADIWPWLVRMGCRRAGWYSCDGLDNGGVPGAARIVPGLQRVQAGGIFPVTPRAQDRFVVRLITGSRGTTGHVALGLMQRRQLLNLKRLAEAA